MKIKYFKKVYSNYIAYGKWKEGDAINYNEPEDKKYTVEFISEQEYKEGITNLVIPKSKEQLIAEKIKELAIESLISEGILDTKGEVI
ncbi:MAG: hypothetical protein ACFFDN_16860 [Candidatus Hodarchaeota archaeon]